MILRRLTVRGNSLFGVWISNGNFPICLSIENYEKRIPAGHHRLRFRQSNRFGPDCLTIDDVPGRSGIRVHVANWPHELEGCVGPGLHIISQNAPAGIDDIMYGLGQSKTALSVLRRAARLESVLTVEDFF